MGCCCSSGEEVSQCSNMDEKTRLLNTLPGQSSFRPDVSEYGSRQRTLNGNLDEQAKLNRIIQKTADNYIDIPAMDSPTEQPDYTDREAHYQKFVKNLKPTLKAEDKTLLRDIPHPEKALSADPVPVVDLRLAEDASEMVHEAVKNVKVSHKEDLLVHFVE